MRNITAASYGESRCQQSRSSPRTWSPRSRSNTTSARRTSHARCMDDLIGMITKHLKKGERVKIAGLGILQVRRRAARMGRNPATGEPINIKASKKVAFRASKDLKMAI